MNNNENVSLLKSVINNTSALLGVKLFMPLSFFLITVSIARVLDVNNFGIFAIILGYYAIFKIISVFGIDIFLIKEIAIYPENAGIYLGNAYLIGSFFSIINILLMNAVFYLAGYSPEVRIPAFILSLTLYPDTLSRYAESALFALHKNKYVFFTTLIREVFKIVFVMSVLFIYKNLTLVILALSVSYFLGFLLNFFTINKFIFKHSFCLRREILLTIVKSSFIFALIGGVSNLFLATDIIVLSKIRGEFSVGLYSVAYKFITCAFLFIDSIGITILPFLSKYFQTSMKMVKEITETTLKYYFIFAQLFVICVFFFSKKIVVLIFGPSFVQSSGILNILIWVTLFLGTSYFLERLLYAVNMQKYDFLCLALATVINITLNIFLTLKYGYLGTAWSTFISTAILFALHYYIFSKKIFRCNNWDVFLKPIFAGLIFFTVFFFSAKVNLYFGFLFSIAVYFSFCVIFKIIKKDELKALLNALFSANAGTVS